MRNELFIKDNINMNKNVPNHIAIIPDGNRRWAKERGLDLWKGHEAGAENTEALMNKALGMGVSHISIWGSSLENLQKRPLAEKRELLRIYEEYFSKLVENETVHDNEVKINFIGRWEEQFPKSLKKVMERCLEVTEKYSERSLNFFLAYSGDDELIEAVRKIVSSGIGADEVNGMILKNNLMTKNLLPVDYLIRTGGEPHLSAGFMMWDIANAQLYFSDSLYPDFNDLKFEEAMEEYEKRQRRFGR